MAFTVKYRGLDVACEKLEDLDRLADSLENTRSRRSPQSQATRHKTRGTVADVFGNLNAKQTKVFRVLMAAAGDVSQEDLRTKLGAKTNQGVGAVIAQISRAAKPHGFSVFDLIEKEMTRNGLGARNYLYRLKEDHADEVRVCLGR